MTMKRRVMVGVLTLLCAWGCGDPTASDLSSSIVEFEAPGAPAMFEGDDFIGGGPTGVACVSGETRISCRAYAATEGIEAYESNRVALVDDAEAFRDALSVMLGRRDRVDPGWDALHTQIEGEVLGQTNGPTLLNVTSVIWSDDSSTFEPGFNDPPRIAASGPCAGGAPEVWQVARDCGLGHVAKLSRGGLVVTALDLSGASEATRASVREVFGGPEPFRYDLYQVVDSVSELDLDGVVLKAAAVGLPSVVSALSEPGSFDFEDIERALEEEVQDKISSCNAYRRGEVGTRPPMGPALFWHSSGYAESFLQECGVDEPEKAEASFACYMDMFGEFYSPRVSDTGDALLTQLDEILRLVDEEPGRVTWVGEASEGSVEEQVSAFRARLVQCEQDYASATETCREAFVSSEHTTADEHADALCGDASVEGDSGACAPVVGCSEEDILLIYEPLHGGIRVDGEPLDVRL